jgi:AGCS family alanine or glycine:cation symporter
MYIFAVLIGPFFTVSAVWTIADIFNALMALPNLIALLALSGVVVKETKSYFERLENGLVIEQTKREKAERKARNLQQA